MKKYNTIFGQLLGLISRSRFEMLVKEHQTEKGAKGLTSWTQFVSMVFGQISGQHGLRGIETGMNSQKSSLFHLGISGKVKEVKRSTLSYANKNRDANLFKSLFAVVLLKAQTMKVSHGFPFKNPLYSIDATTIDLCLKLFPWADFRENKGGIKLTVKLDHQGKIPCFVTESNARQHDSQKIREVPLKADDVVVFDRGYFDCAYFAALTGEKVWFVTRLKKNVKYRIVKKNKACKKSNIISDYEILIPGYSTQQTLRKIIAVSPETGKRITLLTNNHNWSPATIAAVYKDRWQIELFFKAIKQNLKIKRFYGNSKNAVMTQIWIALIVYLLFYILKQQSKNTELSFTNFISVIRTMLFQRRCLLDWLIDPSPPPNIQQCSLLQYEFAF
jgi:putative transposase